MSKKPEIFTRVLKDQNGNTAKATSIRWLSFFMDIANYVCGSVLIQFGIKKYFYLCKVKPDADQGRFIFLRNKRRWKRYGHFMFRGNYYVFGKTYSPLRFGLLERPRHRPKNGFQRLQRDSEKLTTIDFRG
jgi:hypothetical protein